MDERQFQRKYGPRLAALLDQLAALQREAERDAHGDEAKHVCCRMATLQACGHALGLQVAMVMPVDEDLVADVVAGLRGEPEDE